MELTLKLFFVCHIYIYIPTYICYIPVKLLEHGMKVVERVLKKSLETPLFFVTAIVKN